MLIFLNALKREYGKSNPLFLSHPTTLAGLGFKNKSDIQNTLSSSTSYINPVLQRIIYHEIQILFCTLILSLYYYILYGLWQINPCLQGMKFTISVDPSFVIIIIHSVCLSIPTTIEEEQYNVFSLYGLAKPLHFSSVIAAVCSVCLV